MRRKRAGSTQNTWGLDVVGRGVLLLSGGFDSPVAGHLMARQGLDLIAAHFSLEPITDDAAAMKARTLCGILGIPSLCVVRVGEAFAEVAQKANRRFYFILTKRLMIRLADAIADLESAEVLVTGENLGQVSSQTVASLRAIDAVAHHPILRPLIGFDKQEIVDRAKAIGTYEVSKGPRSATCSDRRVPRPTRVWTRSSPRRRSWTCRGSCHPVSRSWCRKSSRPTVRLHRSLRGRPDELLPVEAVSNGHRVHLHVEEAVAAGPDGGRRAPAEPRLAGQRCESHAHPRRRAGTHPVRERQDPREDG